MAAWRIEHLAWREKVGQQLTMFFETTTGKLSETVAGKTTNPLPPAASPAAATPLRPISATP
jgi:hypothetical protein